MLPPMLSRPFVHAFKTDLEKPFLDKVVQCANMVTILLAHTILLVENCFTCWFGLAPSALRTTQFHFCCCQTICILYRCTGLLAKYMGHSMPDRCPPAGSRTWTIY